MSSMWGKKLKCNHSATWRVLTKWQGQELEIKAAEAAFCKGMQGKYVQGE